MDKQTYTTRELMDLCHISHPNKVSMMVKEGVIRPHISPDNLRSYHFTQRDVEKAAKYLKNRPKRISNVDKGVPDFRQLLAANKRLLAELETLKEKLETVLRELS